MRPRFRVLVDWSVFALGVWCLADGVDGDLIIALHIGPLEFGCCWPGRSHEQG